MEQENKKPDNPNVFPDPMRGAEQCYTNQNPELLQEGMTLRDYFAAKALNGLWVSHAHPESGNPSNNEGYYVNWAESCYKMADAMLEERSKQ